MNKPDRKTILLVEDNSVTMMVEEHLLRSCGYDVVAAKSGEEALKIAADNDKIALVLMDINLGVGIDGTEAARQILAKRNLPIVFLSSHTDKDYVERVKEIAGYGYVVKNSGDVVLQSSIEMALNLFKAQTAIRESEEMYRALVEKLPDIVSRLDRDGRHLFVSENVRDVVDFPAAQFIGKTHRELGFPEAQCRIFEEQLRMVFESRKPFETEVKFDTRAGTFIYNTRFMPEQDAQGLVRSVLVLSRDITEHRRAEQNYQTLFREMMDGLALHEIICDGQGNPIDYRFLAVNPAFERMTGLKAEEVIGRTVLELMPKTEQYWIEAYGKVALTGETACFQNYSDEIRKYFEVRAFRPAPVQFVCIVEDITDRKLHEAEKARLETELHQAQKMESVGRLAGGVAHDFNNMLQAILGNADLALQNAKLDSLLRDKLEVIRDCAKRSADLTRQLLAFARRQVIAPKVLDLNKSAESMLKMLQRLIGEDIIVSWLPAPDLWPVMVDPTQVDQILTNLCVNARDAISQPVPQSDALQAAGRVGKITIETRNAVFDATYCADHPGFLPGEYVVLAVIDNGCGMDKETLAHIFEPFFTTKAVGKGIGLGMPMIYGIVKQNKGFINIDSNPGLGTTFEICLPRQMTRAELASKEHPSIHIVQGHATILLVEDDVSILRITTQMLEMQGYTVLAASTPGEAMRMARECAGEIHLLITDVIMPEMNGRELAKNLLSLYPNLKRVFMSGYTADIIAHHGVLDEGVNFIQKPFAVNDLIDMIQKVLI